MRGEGGIEEKEREEREERGVKWLFLRVFVVWATQPSEPINTNVDLDVQG